MLMACLTHGASRRASRGASGEYGARSRLRNLASRGIGCPALAFCVALAASVAAGQARAEMRILAFGDLLTQGYGLFTPEDSFASQLEDWLKENGVPDAAVINAGVSGDTTAGGRARIEWSLAEEPDAVIVELGANDMLRGLPVADIRGNLDAILTAISAENLPILLAGIPAPANYGPEYRTELRETYEELGEEYDAIVYPSFFAGLTEGRPLEQARGLMQPDGIHPNSDGVRAIVEHIGPRVLDLVERAEVQAEGGAG